MMKLTPRQEKQIESQRQADPGKTSFIIDATPEQDLEYELKVKEEMAGRGANQKMLTKLDELLNEDSFVGGLRRALDSSQHSWAELESASAVSAKRLEQFYVGDADLTQTEIDHLVGALGLQLVPASNDD